jgi:erythromycin esterase-like protein
MKYKKIKPLSVQELEYMCIDAQCPAAGITASNEEYKQELMKQAKNVLKLCREVRRLRLTYGEPHWTRVNQTQKEIDAERKLYERK